MSFLTGLLLGAAVAGVLVLARARFLSFRAQDPADLAGRGPMIDPRRHLSGPILCEGVVFGPTGRVTSRFVADMLGDWRGDSGVLRETFRYDTGRVHARAWTLALGPGGAISATAPDVVGTATGQAKGPAIMLRYRIRLEPEAGGHVLDVTDWMYLMANGTIMNRSQFRKYGVTVAELVATLRPAPADLSAAATGPGKDTA